MVLSTRLLVLFLSLLISSVFADYASISAALRNPINVTDIPDLKAKINAYPSPAPGPAFLNILSSSQKLRSDCDKVTSDVNSSAAPTSAQFQTILNFISGPIYTGIVGALKALDAKKSILVANGAARTIVDVLKRTRNSFDNLFNGLITKAPTTALISPTQQIKTNFDNQFNSRITSFGGTP